MINFVLTDSKNYSLVQKQINSTIQSHLSVGSWTEEYAYVEGAVNFTLFIDKKSDVLMSHGAADKNYHFRKDDENRQERMNHTRGRKHLFVPGDWLKRRIVESEVLKYDASTAHAVGWPRLDELFKLQAEHQLRAPVDSRKTILWAPTHDYARRGEESVSLSSYPEFEPYIDELSKNYRVLTSLHPRNRKDKAPTSDALVEADVVISDFGTMVYEAVALGKQVIFPSWIIRERIVRHLKHSAEHFIFSENLGLHATSFEDLVGMIESGQRMDHRSETFFNDYLSPDTYGRSGKITADLLTRLAA